MAHRQAEALSTNRSGLAVLSPVVISTQSAWRERTAKHPALDDHGQRRGCGRLNSRESMFAITVLKAEPWLLRATATAISAVRG
jgi:hypothetical protein